MLNEIFTFIDGNTVVTKIRRVCKKFNKVVRELGPLQAERCVTLFEQPFTEAKLNQLANILKYTNNIRVTNEYAFKEEA
jgi:hypothetical protein